MTTQLFDDEQTARWLTEALEQEAATIVVPPAWETIASRLVDSDWDGRRLTSVSAGGRRRRILGAVGVCATVAAAVLLAVVLGWRPAVLTPQPAAPPVTSVPTYDESTPTLTVYRTNVEVIADNQPKGIPLSITPERLRTDDPDVGRAALTALFETEPIQPGNATWNEQRIDLTSVTVDGGVIRVEMNGFMSHTFSEEKAHVMAQAWVRTLQDSLGVRDDVLLTIQGKPFYLYGAIDTAEPLTRDDSVLVVRPDGFDSPRAGDVVPRTSVLLGSVTAGATQPGRIVITNVDTRELVYDENVSGVGAEPALVDFEPVLTLAPGRYRAALMGHGSDGVQDITFTVVQ